MNDGKQVHDKEYIDATIVIAVNRIVIVNFIRFIRIMMYNCIPLGGKCSVSQQNYEPAGGGCNVQCIGFVFPVSKTQTVARIKCPSE